MARTERESEKREGKKSGSYVGATKTSKQLAEWCRPPQKSFNTLGLPNKKGSPQHQKVSSWKERQSLLCQMKKQQGHLSKSDYEKGKRRTLARKEDGQSESMEQRELHTERW